MFINPGTFEHPVNSGRNYLKIARQKGKKMTSEFIIPELLTGETKNLAPVILNQCKK